MVLVKKENRKWKVYVNFIDLNKACLKDSYPLPRVDQLVDSTEIYELLNFLSAYSKDHKISMTIRDPQKTSFITNQGTYCYNIMPFGLKKVGLTF